MISWKAAARGATHRAPLPLVSALPRHDERTPHFTHPIRRGAGVYEKCGDCRDTFPLGALDRFGICAFCRAEHVAEEDQERRRRFPSPVEQGRPEAAVREALEHRLVDAFQ